MNLSKRCLSGLFAALFVAGPAAATEWHVSGAGDDAHDGRSATAAFRTLKKAAGVVEPGDTVLVGDGVYTDPDVAEHSSLLRLTRSGRPDAPITWRAAPGAHPDLRPTGWNGVLVTCSYNVIDGLNVTGTNDALVLIDAINDGKVKEKGGKKYPGDPKFNTNGIFVTGRLSPADDKPHHNVIRNCTVSKMPGGGIIGIETDYLTIEDNAVFDNAWFMRYGGSGITTLNNWSHDAAPGYHVVIQRNLVWNNKTNVPWAAIEKLSDGNGILLDVSDRETSGAANVAGEVASQPTTSAAATPAASQPAADVRPEWTGRTLVANNVSAFNGGAGVGAFRHGHADLVNNTTYWNGCNVGYPELYANRCTDVAMLNNLIVPRPAGKVTNAIRQVDCRWDYNLYAVPQKALTGPNDLVADPMFVKVPTTYDLRTGDLRLRPGSAALGSGAGELRQPKDAAGTTRPATPQDRGAYAG